METREVSKIAKALSEPKRLEILLLISNNEMCANKILEQFDITQPTLSHHMKLLTECNLINVRKEGKLCYYSTNKNTINEVIEYLKNI